MKAHRVTSPTVRDEAFDFEVPVKARIGSDSHFGRMPRARFVEGCECLLPHCPLLSRGMFSCPAERRKTLRFMPAEWNAHNTCRIVRCAFFCSHAGWAHGICVGEWLQCEVFTVHSVAVHRFAVVRVFHVGFRRAALSKYWAECTLHSEENAGDCTNTRMQTCGTLKCPFLFSWKRI